MSAATLPLLTALVAGFAHALEADHMAAVTTFVSRRPRPLHALGFGIRWGLGHSVALLVAGGIVIWLNLDLPETAVRAMEFGVGAMLVGLGVWAMASIVHPRFLRREHRHAHEHGLPHSHLHTAGHGQGRGTGWVGAAHGLAGTAGFLALLPAAFLGSPWLAGGYLVLFGVGTVAAMGLYALAAGLLFHRVGERAPALGVRMRAAAGLASTVIGIVWMVGAVG